MHTHHIYNFDGIVIFFSTNPIGVKIYIAHIHKTICDYFHLFNTLAMKIGWPAKNFIRTGYSFLSIWVVEYIADSTNVIELNGNISFHTIKVIAHK